MAVANILDEISDILASLKIGQQILRIMLCFEVPLFSFAMLMTELTHKLLNPQLGIRALQRSRCAGWPGFDLPLEGTIKPAPVLPLSPLHATISYHIFDNMNRRTAEQETAEYRSEKHCPILFKNFCCFRRRRIRHSIFINQKNIFTQMWSDRKWVNKAVLI
jgi:hypothetical protein